MGNLKQLLSILAAVLVLSSLMGYYDAYKNSLIPMRVELKLSLSELGALLGIMGYMSTGLNFIIQVLLTAISYRVAISYKLNLGSGAALVVSVYLCQVAGRFIGLFIEQALFPLTEGSPALIDQMFYSIVTNYSYVPYCLIGVLAANYVRATRTGGHPINVN